MPTLLPSLPTARYGRGVIAAVGLLALCGCTLGRRDFQPAQSPDRLDDMAFLHYLPTVPVVTVDEGSRAVLLLVGPSNRWPSHEARWNELLRRSAVRDSWRLHPDQMLDKSTLAYMLCALCDSPQSLNQVLASRSGLGDRRYALRTCIYEGLLPYARPQDPVTGGEMLSALQSAEKYQKSDTANRG